MPSDDLISSRISQITGEAAMTAFQPGAIVIVGSLLLSSVAFAQTRTETADPVVTKFGFSTGILARHGESFDGTNTALGGWSTISVGRWGIDADFSRSRQLERRGEACLDRTCSRSAAGTESKRTWRWELPR